MTNTEERNPAKRDECQRPPKGFAFRDLFRISSRLAGFRTSDFGFRISKYSLSIMVFAALAGTASAQFTRPEGNSARSVSGQFVVRALRGPAVPKPTATTTNQNLGTQSSSLVIPFSSLVIRPQALSSRSQALSFRRRRRRNLFRMTAARVL